MTHNHPAKPAQDLFGWVTTSSSLEYRTPELKAAESARDSNTFRNTFGGVSSTDSICAFGENSFVALAGLPRWTNTTLAGIAQQHTHAEAFAKAYALYGKNLLEHVRGPFSFVLFDGAQKKLLAAIDRIGQQALYYSENDEKLIFGMSASSVLAQTNEGAQLNPQGIFDYVYFHMIPSPQSVYSGLRKLPAAHCLEFSNGKVEVSRYWSPHFDKKSGKPFVELGAELKEQLRNAVERSQEGTTSVGTFLSGGLDSSTVTGMLADISGGDKPAYAIGFDEDGYDEMAYARKTARHFGVNLREYYVTPQDVLNELPKIAASYDEPFGNSSALPAYFCAKLAAQDGVERLLAGDGGDEIFAGNERYAQQSVYNIYSMIPRILRIGLVEPFVAALPNAIPLAPKAKSYIAKANTALPDRLQDYNFLHRFSPNEVFADDFIADVLTTLPLELLRETFWSPKNASELDRMLYLDWQYTLADNDLRKVNRMCNLAGVDVSYPMLDEDLIDFSCTIPDKWKLKPGSLRHFYKKSLRGWLPDSTIDKEKHGFGLPFGLWMQSYKPLREMAYNSVQRLKRRGYFKDSFLDRIIELHRSEHATYYGEMIWILTILDLWMDGRETQSSNRIRLE